MERFCVFSAPAITRGEVHAAFERTTNDGNERIGKDDEVCVQVARFGFGIGFGGRGGADGDRERDHEHGSCFHWNFDGGQLTHLR